MNSDVDGGPLQRRASIYTKNLLGCCVYLRSPFFIAVQEGDVAEVSRFIHEDALWLKKFDVTQRRTAWHIAAANGHVEVLRVLASRCRDDDVGLVHNSQPTLSSRIRAAAMLATTRGPLGPDERVTELVNGRAGWGVIPLALAAEGDHLETVKYLLSQGADPWLSDHEGLNPSHYAARMGSIKALQVLLELDPPMSARASTNNPAGTRYVDSMDVYGFTPLHYATWANRKSAMMLLIGFDANLISRSRVVHNDFNNLHAGFTPLHIACLLGDLERVKLLLRAYYETAADLLPSQTALLGPVERRRRARSHPDPRLILTRTQRLPFHIAARSCHRHLLDWLDPSIPLMFLFGGEEDAGSGGQADGGRGMVALVGVSRLTVIASKALHQALLNSLDMVAEEIRLGEQAAEEQRRRREQRRVAREAEAAAQSLKQGKEPPPEGLRGRIRRLIQRPSKDDGGGGGDSAAAAVASAGGRTATCPASSGPYDASKAGSWRPWRSRGARRSRKRAAADGAPPASTIAATAATTGQEASHPHGSMLRSPRRRRRRSALGMGARVSIATTVVDGGGRQVVAVAPQLLVVGAAGVRVDGGISNEEEDAQAAPKLSGGSTSGEQAQRKRSIDSQMSRAVLPPLHSPRLPVTSGTGVLNTSLRLRIFRGSGSQFSPQQQQQQQRMSNSGATGVMHDGGQGAASASGAAGTSGRSTADGSSGGGGGLATSLTRTMLQRLYRGSVGRQSIDASLNGGPAAAHLNQRLSRAGITIPEGPDEVVAYFTPGREPRYNMPTQILLPASAFATATLREASASAATATTTATTATPASCEPPPLENTSPARAESAGSEGGAGGVVGRDSTYSPCTARRSESSLDALDERCLEAGPIAGGTTSGDRQARGLVKYGGGDGGGCEGGLDVGDTGPGGAVTVCVEDVAGGGERHSCSAGEGRGGGQLVGDESSDGGKVLAAIDSSGVAGTELDSATLSSQQLACRGQLQELVDGLSQKRASLSGIEQLSLVATSSKAPPSPPLQPRLPPLAVPWSDLAASYITNEDFDPAASILIDRALERSRGSPAPSSVLYLPIIRSMGTSRVPSRRQSLELPGTTARTPSESEVPSPSALLIVPPPPPPPGQRQNDGLGEGGDGDMKSAGARSSLSGSDAPAVNTGGGCSRVLEALPQLAEHLAVYDAEVVAGGAATAAIAVATTGAELVGASEGSGANSATGTTGSDPSWFLASGMGRVGAGARHLLDSLRGTMRRTGGKDQAQVFPAPEDNPCPSSPGGSPSRGAHYRRRNRTPDVSSGRGRLLQPVASAMNPAVPTTTTMGTVAFAATDEGVGTQRSDMVDIAPSPNTSQHRGAAFFHPHSSVAARGVRVASARPHARIALFNRLSAGTSGSTSEGGFVLADQFASGSGVGSGGNLTRRRLPFRRSAVAVATAMMGQSAAGGQPAQGERKAEEEEEAEASGSEDAVMCPDDDTKAGAAALKMGEAVETLSAADAVSYSSFSSTRSQAGGGGDEEDVCPVCLDEAPNLLVQACRHLICLDCARDLVRHHSLTPALCPYCRGVISNFTRATARGPAGGA